MPSQLGTIIVLENLIDGNCTFPYFYRYPKKQKKMKRYLLLLLLAVIFFSATTTLSENSLKHDGVYVGKIEFKQERGSLIEYHYIVFKGDGKAETFIMSSNNINDVKEKIKNSNSNFQGEYRVHENNVVYRSVNKNKTDSINSFIFYSGKINENGSISLEAMFANNSKINTTFNFQPLK